MALDVRLATELDIPILQDLIPASVRALSTGYYTDRQIESALRYIFGVDSQLIADGTYYAVASDDEVVGCGGWSKRKTLFGGDQIKEEFDDLLDPAREPARIRAFFVHPRWTRRGIGRSIIEACESAALQQGFRGLELVATLPGEPLYAAMGYAVTRRFDIAMPDGESLPAANMVKSFRQSATRKCSSS